MLQFIMEKNILIYALAAACVIGVVSQMILRRIYDGLLKDAGNTGEPEGRFMQQLRQRFQYCTHLNEQVKDVRVLIQKSLMEYRVWGLCLHGWQRISGGCLMVSLLCAAVGTMVRVQNQATAVIGNMYFWMGAGAFVLMALAWAAADIGYRRSSLEISLCDYLENSGAIRVYSEEDDLPDLEYETEKTPSPVISSLEGRRTQQRIKAETAVGAVRGQKRKNTAARSVKAGMQETAVSDADRPDGDRGAKLLREMDPKEQERLVREVLNEFLSQ